MNDKKQKEWSCNAHYLIKKREIHRNKFDDAEICELVGT